METKKTAYLSLQRMQATPSVAGDASLAVTGSFKALSRDLTLRIFDELDTPTRLLVTSCVCKAWRGLRAEPSLWRRLTLHTRSRCGGAGEDSAAAFGNDGVVALLSPGGRSPLPFDAPGGGGCTAVKALEILDKSTLQPGAWRRIVAAAPAAVELRYCGTRVTDKVLSAMCGLQGPALRVLCVEGAGKSVTPAAWLAVLGATPCLRELTLQAWRPVILILIPDSRFLF